jgi:hypothetical protein
MTKPKTQSLDSSDENQFSEGTLAILKLPQVNQVKKKKGENKYSGEMYSMLHWHKLYRNTLKGETIA